MVSVVDTVRFPIAEAVELIGDDAGAGFEVAQELWLELSHDGGVEVHEDDGGGAEVGFEEILLDEFDAAGEAGLLGGGAGLEYAVAFDFDADAARAEVFGGVDEHAAVAGAEVVDGIARGDARHAEEGVHDFVRRGDPRDIALTFFVLGKGRRDDERQEGATMHALIIAERALLNGR